MNRREELRKQRLVEIENARVEKEKRVAERQKQKDEEQLALFNAKREAKPAITTI